MLSSAHQKAKLFKPMAFSGYFVCLIAKDFREL
jgi:hypothetical protein